MKKAYIQTFGCQMNEHDSARMADILASDGYTICDQLEESDLVLLNTCSVRENPENKVYSHLGRLRKLKQERSDLIVGVGGCVAQQEGENILKREPSVDMVFGTDAYYFLPEMIAAAREGERVLNLNWLPREKKVQNFIPTEGLETGEVKNGKAYISITKGCNNFCAFCIVPTTRGREVSRELDNILIEAHSLVARGAKEICLLGQNVNSYQAHENGFYELLQAVADIRGLERLRFTSPHPKDWNDTLSDLMASHPVICNQLHLPFQAGSDRILRKMRRGHKIEEYLAKLDYLKAKIPGVSLSTDLIVGFPSETEEEFADTLKVLEYARFHQVYAFKYSSRPGTLASRLPDDVPPQVKAERLEQVLRLHARIQNDYLDLYQTQAHQVLLESPHPKEAGAMQGRTEANISVTVRACDLPAGSHVRVQAVGRKRYSLIAELA